MVESARGTSSTPRSYYSSNRGSNNNSHNISALFRDEKDHHHVVESLGLDLNHLNHPQHSSHRQFKDNDDGDDGSTSLGSFQKIKDERDYDRRSYSRKRSGSYDKTTFVRTSSPDRGGGGSNYHLDDNFYNDKKYSKDYGNRQSGSRESESTISYIDYNDSFIDRKRGRDSGQKHGSVRPTATDDRRLGSTVRTDIRTGSTATASTITFDDYNRSRYNHSQPRQQQPQQQGQHPQQPFVGHDGKSVNHAKYRSEDDYSTVSKPQVPIDITVPSPNKFVQKTSLNMHQHRNYSGRELKKPPYSSSSKVHVHEMGSRRHVSKRRSSSKSRASPREVDRKSRSNSRSSKSTRSRSSGGKRSNSSRSRSSDGKRSSSSRRSKDSSKSGGSNGRSKSRTKNSSDDDVHRSRRRDLKREKSTRHLEFNDHSDQRSVKSSSSDKERHQRDRRRDMMTGRATKHLLDDDKSTNSRSSKSTYSRSSVRYDVDDDGYCMHHPEIELMRLKSDGFWSTVRKKCPECIYEDFPSLLGDIGVDKEDEIHEDDNNRSTATPSSNDESAAARAILNSTRLFSFHNIMSPEDIEKEEELRRLKRRLAARAYHFPGNTWWQDWMQYLSNTHTVLGLFFHQ